MPAHPTATKPGPLDPRTVQRVDRPGYDRRVVKCAECGKRRQLIATARPVDRNGHSYRLCGECTEELEEELEALRT